jgi:hypothetical protein
VFPLLTACFTGKKPDNFIFTRATGAQVVDPGDEWYSLCVSSGLGQFAPAKRKNGKEFLAYRGLNLYFQRAAIWSMTRRGVSETVAMKIGGQQDTKHRSRPPDTRFRGVD